MSEVYGLGRPVRRLIEPYTGEDATYAGDRLDHGTLTNARLRHCTLVNVSFKATSFAGCQFVNCVFVGCYFRRADLRNCEFTGCRFVDCNFTHVAIRSCGFRYSSFKGCQISYTELRHSLPREPNVREDLSRNLSIESATLGLLDESARYRDDEIRAHEENLKAAITAESQWYREHYDGPARLRALFQLIVSLLNRHIWGYGQSPYILARNFALLVFVIFPATFYLVRGDLAVQARPDVRLRDLVYFSLENALPAKVTSGIVAVGDMARLIATLEAVIGLVFAGLMVSVLFRRSLRR